MALRSPLLDLGIPMLLMILDPPRTPMRRTQKALDSSPRLSEKPPLSSPHCSPAQGLLAAPQCLEPCGGCLHHRNEQMPQPAPGAARNIQPTVVQDHPIPDPPVLPRTRCGAEGSCRSKGQGNLNDPGQPQAWWLEQWTMAPGLVAGAVAWGLALLQGERC